MQTKAPPVTCRILMFLVVYRKARRINKQAKPGTLTAKLWDELSIAFVKWLALSIDRYVTGVYMPNHDFMRVNVLW